LKNVEKEIIKLRKQISEYDYQYYTADSPSITDENYDMLFNKLERLEKKYPEFDSPVSPTKRVGGTVLSKLMPVEHSRHILSLGKAKSIDALYEWFKSVSFADLIGQYKLDGLTIVVRYEKGKMVQAITRGDGFIGEDVTHNAVTIKNLPLFINYQKPLEVRGEGIIYKRQFEEINKSLPFNKQYATSRNLSAGSLRQLDSAVCSERGLKFIAYDIIKGDDSAYYSHAGQISFLKQLGFDTVYSACLKDFDSVKEFIDTVGKERNLLEYDIDGVVFKVDDISKWKSLGEKDRVPNYAIAYKYEDKKHSTILEDVEWTVSRTRRINPVGIIKPIKIDGTDVSRVTLNNIDFIKDLELGIGDSICVVKANQIIPQIVDNYSCSDNIEVPVKCPACGEKIVRDGAYLRCSNSDCIGAKYSAFTHFVSRSAMNIKGLSISKLWDLIDNKIIKNFDDIYSFTENKQKIGKLLLLEGWGRTSVENLIKAIDVSRNTTLDRMIYALGIPEVGCKTAYNICEYYGWSLDNILELNYYELLLIQDIGEKTAKQIYRYFKDKDNVKMIKSLAGELIFDEEEIILVSEKLAGKVFCITGTLSKSRNDFAEIIEKNGGEFTNSITKKVNYLIVGENAGNDKLSKAEHSGIKIINEKQFLKMI
jgi:DNA ligase (NAD+)